MNDMNLTEWFRLSDYENYISNTIYDLNKDLLGSHYVECALCGYRGLSLTKHLFDCHNMTTEQYVSKYPDQKVLVTNANNDNATSDLNSVISEQTKAYNANDNDYTLSRSVDNESVVALFTSNKYHPNASSETKLNSLRSLYGNSYVKYKYPDNCPIDDNKIRIYLAGPYFNDDHKKSIDTMRDTLSKMSDKVYVYSPFHNGINFSKLVASSKVDDREYLSRVIYLDNIEAIQKSDIILALIDDRDIGTVYEIGFGVALRKPVITFSSHQFGVNLMLSSCVLAHSSNQSLIPDYLNAIYKNYKWLLSIYGTMNYSDLVANLPIIRNKLFDKYELLSASE